MTTAPPDAPCTCGPRPPCPADCPNRRRATPGPPSDVTGAVLAATEAAWQDNERRNPYPSRQAFGDLPRQTQDSWLADTRAAVRAYLAERAEHEHRRNGQSSRWWALAWELEQITKEPA